MMPIRLGSTPNSAARCRSSRTACCPSAPAISRRFWPACGPVVAGPFPGAIFRIYINSPVLQDERVHAHLVQPPGNIHPFVRHHQRPETAARRDDHRRPRCVGLIRGVVKQDRPHDILRLRLLRRAGRFLRILPILRTGRDPRIKRDFPGRRRQLSPAGHSASGQNQDSRKIHSKPPSRSDMLHRKPITSQQDGVTTVGNRGTMRRKCCCRSKASSRMFATRRGYCSRAAASPS